MSESVGTHLTSELYRVVGVEHGWKGQEWPFRKIYRRKSDAIWRAKMLHKDGQLDEFSVATVEWKPAPSEWLAGA